MTWARAMWYAAGVLGAACLAVLLAGSPAAADEGDSGLGLAGDLVSTVGSGLTEVERTVDGTVRQAVGRVAGTERRVTDAVRTTTHEVAPVPVVTDAVDQVTGVVDDATTQVSGQVPDQVDETDAVTEPVDDPTGAAELVSEPRGRERTAPPRRAPDPADRTAPALLEQVSADAVPGATAAEAAVVVQHLPPVVVDVEAEQAAPATTPDLPTDGAGSVDGPTVSGLAILGGSAVLSAPTHLDVLTRDRSVHASPPHRPGFSPD